MPRANRYHVPGLVWHITHRCHNREFLLKFARDRRRWVGWLFEARKRYGLTVLNYMCTSNHIHLLTVEQGDTARIAQSMQLVAGRTGREYNGRKRRRGAFWEDRYHATAVECGEHLARCMAYIDMNMVRAGVVRHPEEWEWCGFQAIQRPPQRYQIVDRHRAAELLGCESVEALAAAQRAWTESALRVPNGRESKWSESIAVGSQAFTESVCDRLGIKARFRAVQEAAEEFVLRECDGLYGGDSNSQPKTSPLSDDNTRPWRISR